ncbi:MAG: porin, partial [Roseicyclus sp.]
MKKVLFATTALVATAGVAAADVAVSGGAEMGLFGGSGTETQFFTDIDV